MTQHKVIAEDSLSAMDEISRVLGKDAVILKTEKINGKIHILGSNDIEDLASSNAKKLNKQKSNFSHLFTNHNLHQKTQDRKILSVIDKNSIEENNEKAIINDQDNNLSKHQFVDTYTFRKFTDKIENLLKNMIITDINGLGSHNSSSLTIKLLEKVSQNRLFQIFKRDL